MAECPMPLGLVRHGCTRWALPMLLSLVALGAHAFQVVDDRGKAVELAHPAQRVVTMLPSLTETVCELGACERLVGVDDFSNQPDAVRKLPHVGGVEDANIERIVALKPDLVLLLASSRAMVRLESLGIPVFGFELKTLADVRRALDKTAQLLGVPGADRAWSRIETGIAAAARELPKALRGTSVYVEVDSGPYAASEISHVGEILSRLGLANIVPGRLGSVPKLNPEFVVRADPQVIIIAARDAPSLRERPGWNRMHAIREGRVCALTPTQGDVVMRPGPRLAQAARIIVDCIKARAGQRP
jgi:iron complex transport system substrate-binding protein